MRSALSTVPVWMRSSSAASWWRNSVLGGRKWIGNLLLRSPASLRYLSDVPILGYLIHRISHRILPINETVWASIKAGPAAGLCLELNPRTGQSYVRGEAEAQIQKVLAARLRPGMVFYDLGANIGLFTLLAARLVGAKGRVISFEPDGEVAARLRRNIERNRFANVTVIEAGVWSKSGYVNFVPADSSSPDHGLGRFVGEQMGQPGHQSNAWRWTILSGVHRHRMRSNATWKGLKSKRYGVRRSCSGLTVHGLSAKCIRNQTNKPHVSSLLALVMRVETLDCNHVLAVPKREL